MGIFGLHEQSMLLLEQRTQILAKNIANADTPHFKARDIDFAAVLQGTEQPSTLAMQQTNSAHLNHIREPLGTVLKYRHPLQNSKDGNTVDSQIEQAQFSENSVRYLASLSFINQAVNRIMIALKGDS